jgi:hypothetical protein
MVGKIIGAFIFAAILGWMLGRCSYDKGYNEAFTKETDKFIKAMEIIRKCAPQCVVNPDEEDNKIGQ